MVLNESNCIILIINFTVIMFKLLNFKNDKFVKMLTIYGTF